ncbi:hypothetical protein JRI60_21590 [Archangium violaceum]|uniref:hypothetical protein n=1 Tax=Archangium violaceum TaxID=83451 RepID=UPI00194EE1E1|nr:hypothetical protein [Archangium violaceum]QRO01424.1 hypothetical protein JRI60_21590 [Archangium violaceum]
MALFLRDPEGYRTRQEARQLKQEAAVYLTAETVGRFLESMHSAGTNFNQEATRRTTEVQCVRDVLCIHAKTGMHGTEIERLARGEGKVVVLEEPGEIAATVTFIHKSGNVHRQSIDRQTLAAVQRLQARGAAPVDSHIRRVVGRACKELGIEPVRFGEYRHSLVRVSHFLDDFMSRASGAVRSP